MSRVIHRAEVHLNDTDSITLRAHRICRIEAQPGSDAIEIWFETDEYADDRNYRVIGTGHPFKPFETWVASTARTRDGFVWHLVNNPRAGQR